MKLRPKSIGSAATVIFTVALALVVGAYVAGDDDVAPEAEPSAFTEEVAVDLVLMEAVVVDRGGNHVRGLTKDDFTVWEAGERVPIVTFDEIDLAEVATSRITEIPESGVASTPEEFRRSEEVPLTQVDGEDEGAAEAPRAAVAEERSRNFVFLFDGYNNAAALRLVQARKAALKFARTEMRPGDRAAVYEISPFLIGHTYLTSDLPSIEDAIDDIRWFPGEALGDEIMDSAVYTGNIGSRRQTESGLRNMAGFGANQNSWAQQQYFMALGQLAEVLATEQGRKIVLWFSGGFPLAVPAVEMSTGGYTYYFKQAVRNLEKSRSTVYSFTIGDDEELLGDASNRSNYGLELDRLGFGADFVDTLGFGIAGTQNTGLAREQVLAIMAHESGGRFFGGHNYGRSLLSVSDDTQHFYLIGYTPPTLPEAETDRGRYRTVKIAVDRKRTRVVSRKGRFVAAESEALPTAATLPAHIAATSATEGVAGSTAEHTLSCGPVVFPTATDKAVVALPMRLEGPVQPVATTGGELILDVSTRVVVRDGETEVDRVERSYRIGLKPAILEQIGRGFRLTDAVELAPGNYDLEATVRLNGQGIREDWEGSLHVGRLDPGVLALSGLTLLADDSEPPLVVDQFVLQNDPEATDSPGPDDPFNLANGWRVLGRPSAAVDPSVPLALFFRAHGVTADPETGKPSGLSLEYVVVPEGGGEEILPPIQLVYFKNARQSDAYDVLVQIDLSSASPGDYTLHVDAADGAADARARSSHAFRIAPPSNSLDQSKVSLNQ